MNLDMFSDRFREVLMHESPVVYQLGSSNTDLFLASFHNWVKTSLENALNYFIKRMNLTVVTEMKVYETFLYHRAQEV